VAALLALAACASPSADPAPAECWTLQGVGPIGDTSEGFLCVKTREGSCWRCFSPPPAPPKEYGP